ncbi:unnamed protein product [Sphenostylis stenocarpa]|uniref:Uncharacterized protein n=1 Tax=Sphenostylis stenocarpa TaxID=92480 RepID=A0AA86S774_9FABA|nr:unnamed protein product [Sphenostylis stenocarpa]
MDLYSELPPDHLWVHAFPEGTASLSPRFWGAGDAMPDQIGRLKSSKKNTKRDCGKACRCAVPLLFGEKFLKARSG